MHTTFVTEPVIQVYLDGKAVNGLGYPSMGTMMGNICFNYCARLFERMHTTHTQLIISLFLVVSIASCAANSTSEQMPSAVVPMQQSSTAIPSIPSALSDSSINSQPTVTITTVEIEPESDQDNSILTEATSMNIQVGDTVLIATLAENSSADALMEALSQGPITVQMHEYGSMEKVGSLGMVLPRNDEQITTTAGDLILYQGSEFVIYYAPNSWNFTRLGKINDVTAEELREILGDGDVTITLSISQN